jgi:hypothetical protein
MQLVYANVAALAVAILYYGWRTWHEVQLHRRQRLRERVVYMLWVMARQIDDPRETLVLD